MSLSNDRGPNLGGENGGGTVVKSYSRWNRKYEMSDSVRTKRSRLTRNVGGPTLG